MYCTPATRPLLHPMTGLKNREEEGEVLAGWLAISGGQVTTSSSEDSKLPTDEESKLPTAVFVTLLLLVMVQPDCNEFLRH